METWIQTVLCKYFVFPKEQCATLVWRAGCSPCLYQQCITHLNCSRAFGARVPGPPQQGPAVSNPKGVWNELLGCKYMLKHFSHHQLLERKITKNPPLLYGSQMTEKPLHVPAIKWCVMRCFGSWSWRRWNHSMKQRGRGKTEESAYTRLGPLQEMRH